MGPPFEMVKDICNDFLVELNKFIYIYRKIYFQFI